MDRNDLRTILTTAIARISAGADFGQEVILSPDECEALIKWIRGEKYRHRKLP